mgnify:CR=1 FL=1|tara:strand:+ start:220 stop:453 length:234 start_codon:yes stop_codon:yes gene_type:complete
MYKLIITIGALISMSYGQVDNQELSETLNHIQDMREWMIEDRNNGVIDSVYAEYYILWLNNSEDLLIEHFNKLNTNK